MGTTQIMTHCMNKGSDHHDDDNPYRDSSREFWITIEFKDSDGFHELAEETECPVCGSDEWSTTDTARNR